MLLPFLMQTFDPLATLELGNEANNERRRKQVQRQQLFRVPPPNITPVGGGAVSELLRRAKLELNQSRMREE